MHLRFSWFYILQAALFFSAIAQEVSEEKTTTEEPQETTTEQPQETTTEQEPTTDQNKPQEQSLPLNQETIKELEKNENGKKHNINQERFISHNEKPAIFGSHAYNPITQEFEEVPEFNATAAHNISFLHTSHTPPTTSTVADDTSTKSRVRLGHFRAFKKLTEASDTQPSPGSGLRAFGNSTLQLISALNNSLTNLTSKSTVTPDDRLNKI